MVPPVPGLQCNCISTVTISTAPGLLLPNLPDSSGSTSTPVIRVIMGEAWKLYRYYHQLEQGIHDRVVYVIISIGSPTSSGVKGAV